jgi:hypothetical protein
MTEADVKKLVGRAIERAGGVRALAREWDVSPAQISDVMNGRRGPGPKVLRNLGMRRTVQFVKAG